MRHHAIKRSVLKKYIRRKLETDPTFRMSQLDRILIHAPIKSSRIRNNLWRIVREWRENSQRICDGKIALRYWRYSWQMICQNGFMMNELTNQAMKDGFLKPGRDNNAIADSIGNLV